MDIFNGVFLGQLFYSIAEIKKIGYLGNNILITCNNYLNRVGDFSFKIAITCMTNPQLLSWGLRQAPISTALATNLLIING